MSKKYSKSKEQFIDALAIPGMTPLEAKIIAMEKKGENSGELNAHTPSVQAVRLRKNIEERKKLAAKFANVTPEMILGATAMRAFASIDDAFDEDGNFDMQKARETGAIHLIKKLEKTAHGFRVEFYSNESAQDKLGNYLGMERAPMENNDTESLKAGVEAVAKKLAEANGQKMSNSHLVLAWERVAEWAMKSKSKYSPSAIDELDKHYKSLGSMPFMTSEDMANEVLKENNGNDIQE